MSGYERRKRIGFGAMQLPGPGVWGPPADRAAAVAVVRRAVELGVSYIDTSDFYGPHVANEVIREAAHPYPSVTVGTKVGVVRSPDRMFQPAAAPAQLRHQVEENLVRLGVTELNVVHLRVGGDGLLPPDGTPFAESFGALSELRDQGLIVDLALSGVTVAQVEEALTIAPVTAVQNRFNLFDRSAADVLARCEQLDIAFLPYFPLAPWAQPTADQQAAIGEVAARHDATRAQVLLAWLLAVSPKTFPIPGTSSIAHLEENLAAADVDLTAEEVAGLSALA